MPMSEEKLKYFAEYKREHLKKIQLDVRNEYYTRLKNVCELDGTTVSKFVRNAIDSALTAREKRLGIDPSWRLVIFEDKDGHKQFRRAAEVDERYKNGIF